MDSSRSLEIPKIILPARNGHSQKECNAVGASPPVFDQNCEEAQPKLGGYHHGALPPKLLSLLTAVISIYHTGGYRGIPGDSRLYVSTVLTVVETQNRFYVPDYDIIQYPIFCQLSKKTVTAYDILRGLQSMSPLPLRSKMDSAQRPKPLNLRRLQLWHLP